MFLKKIFLLLTINSFLLSGLFASNFTVQIEKIDNNSVSIEFNSTNYFGENQDNWIALFKTNTPNVWANVRSWAWIKDLSLHPTQTPNSEARKFQFQGEEDGEYEIRFFENNSYTPHTIQPITLEASQNRPFIEITVQNQYGDLILKSTNADKAWVGLFKKDLPSTRENILNWKWVRPVDHKTYFNTNALASGDYQARLFFNNTYDLEAEIDFRLNQEGNRVIFDGIQTYNGEGNIEVSLSNFNHSGGDWIGVFKPNAVHIIDNLVAYAYVPQGVNNVELITYQPELLTNGTYTLVYFVRSSYVAFGQSGQLTVDLN